MSTKPPVHWVKGFFLVGKAVEVWHNQQRSSSTEVKEIVDLYVYFPSGPHGLLQGEIYHFLSHSLQFLLL